jgi:hypothetical protein
MKLWPPITMPLECACVSLYGSGKGQHWPRLGRQESVRV